MTRSGRPYLAELYADQYPRQDWIQRKVCLRQLQTDSPYIDGSIKVAAIRGFFVLAGIKSGAMGALFSWLTYNYLSWRWLSYSILAVFGFRTARAFLQGLISPYFLDVTFGRSSITGPSILWIISEEIATKDVDWEKSGFFMGQFIVYGVTDQEIRTRLDWYGPSGASELERQWEYFRRVHDTSGHAFT